MIIKFSTYIDESKRFENYYLNLLSEEKAIDESGSNNDTKGKLHELLVGYHLNGGKHMDKHVDEYKNTPQQAHDLLMKNVSEDQYKKIYDRAKETADHIKSELKKSGKTISHVHWTSKPGDIEASTSVPSTQKQDASDIMLHTVDKKGKKGYTGVSLKVSDEYSKHVPVSNAGQSAMYPGVDNDIKAHKEKLYKSFPELKNLTNEKLRKEWLKSDPERKDKINNINLAHRRVLTAKAHEHLLSMGNHELIDHVKTHVLQSNPTPLQQAGHEHIRHTVYAGKKKEGGGNKFHSYDPAEHFKNILDGSKKIHVTNPSGTTQLHYHYEDENGNLHHFASQRFKSNSNSDPFSSMKSSGIAAGD
jgi:hypothetical protein